MKSIENNKDMAEITEILLSVASKGPQNPKSGKTLLIDGIEYYVYLNSDSFTFCPVCTEEYVYHKYLRFIPFGWQYTDEFRAEYKSIKVIG